MVTDGGAIRYSSGSTVGLPAGTSTPNRARVAFTDWTLAGSRAGRQGASRDRGGAQPFRGSSCPWSVVAMRRVSWRRRTLALTRPGGHLRIGAVRWLSRPVHDRHGFTPIKEGRPW